MNKRKTLEVAQKYAQKGAYDKALKEYAKLLKADPKDTNVLLKIGDLHLKRGGKAEAIESYTQVAEVFSKQGFDAKAVAIYKQILQIDPEGLDSHVRLGDLYQRLGLASEALREFQKAVDLCQERGLKREAFDLLRRVASLDPANIPNRLKLADLFAREGLEGDARREYESILEQVVGGSDPEITERVCGQMLEAFPDHPEALQVFAQSAIACDNVQGAIESLQAALPHLPDDIPIREALIRCYEAVGDDEAVQRTYREVAELYKRRGDHEQARDILQRFVPVEPFALPDNDTTPSILLSQAVIEEDPLQASAEEPVPAAAPVEEIASLSADADDLLAEARVSLEFDDLDDAERLARAVLAKDSSSDGARDVLARICLQRGHRTEAIRIQEERRDLAATCGARDLLQEIESTLRELRTGAASAPAPPEIRAEPAEAQLVDPEPPTPTGPGVPAESVGPSDLVGPDTLTGTTGPRTPRPSAPPPAPSARAPKPPPAPEPQASAPAVAVADAETLPDVEILLEDTDDQDAAYASIEPPPELRLGATRAQAPSSRKSPPVPAPVAPTDSLEEPEEIEIQLEAPQPSAEEEDEAPESSSSAADSTHIAESLEEAEFYLEQGMLDAAERIFRRVIAVVPHHPQALLRLGELARARGELPDTAQTFDLEDGLGDTTVRSDPPASARVGSPAPPAPSRAESPVEELSGRAAEEEGGEPVEDVLDGLDVDLDLGLEEDPVTVAEAPALGEPPAEKPIGGEETRRPADPPPPEPGASLPPELPQIEPDVPVLDPSEGESEPDMLDLDLDVDPDPSLLDPAEEETAYPLEPAAEERAAVTPPVPVSPEQTSPTPLELGDEPEAGAELELDVDLDSSPAAAEGDFDLAAELAAELADGEGKGAGEPVAEGIEAVFSAFKRGIQEQLGEEECDAHYDLAIAYKEMGLLEDAVQELELAQRGSSRRLEALALMATCELELGRAPRAVEHLTAALKLASGRAETEIPVRYDLGLAYLALGKRAEARDAFRVVAELDPAFREVRQHLAELQET